MSNCLFCKIIKREINVDLIHKDNHIVVFKDINPQAPTHLLIVPRKHIATLNDLTPQEDAIVGAMIRRASLIAKELGHHQKGYRVLLNCNNDGGQTVFHIHLHLLAGRSMSWPPG